MPTEKSVQAVAELEEDFKSSPLVIAAEYRGLNVGQMQGMRRAVRQSNSQFKIAKNTLARIAADNCGRPELKQFIDGPIGFLTTESDPATAAKVLVNYIDDNNIEMTIIGGALDGEVLTSDRVMMLAKLPSKEVLLAKLLGSMNSPLTGLLRVMNGPIGALAIVLQRISELGAVAETDEAPAAEAEVADTEAPADEAAPVAETDDTAAAEMEAAEIPEVETPVDSSDATEPAEASDESGEEKTE